MLQTIKAEPRELTGKGAARALRREGKVPAIIYGKDAGEHKVTVNLKELTHMHHKEGFMTRLLEVNLGGKKFKTLPVEFQFHPVTDVIEHADFRIMATGAVIHLKIPVHFINQENSVGIKNGGILNAVHRELELICDVDHIPAHIDIDVSALDIGDSLHLSSIELPKGSKLYGHEHDDITLVTIVGMTAEEEPEVVATEEAAAPVPSEEGAAEASEGEKEAPENKKPEKK